MTFAPLSLLSLASLAGNPAASPAIEYSTVLSAIEVQPQSAAPGKGGRLRIGGSGIQAAFLPGPDIWMPGDVEASGGHRMVASLSLGDAEVAKFGLYVQRIEGVFSRASVRGITSEMEASGFVTEFLFEQAGSYSLAIQVDGVSLVQVPFEVHLDQTGDSFQPEVTTRVSGPWEDWGYLAVRPDKENAAVELRTWLRQQEPGKSDDFEATVFRGDQPVAKAGKVRMGQPTYQLHEFRFGWLERTPGSYGIDVLTQSDGDYSVVVTRNGEPYGSYPFRVQSGALVPHERSQDSHAGQPDYLLPRLWSQRSSERRATTWCARQ